MAEPLTQERLQEIRERCEGLSPGEWTAVDHGTPGLGYSVIGCPFGVRYEYEFLEDATFVAHSRKDLPDLLSAYTALQACCQAQQQRIAVLESSLRKTMLGEAMPYRLEVK